MKIIEKKYWYFALSLLVIIPGIISLILWGLNLSIDFTGGSRLTFSGANTTNSVSVVQQVFQKEQVNIVSLQNASGTISIRTKPIDNKKHTSIITDLSQQAPNLKEEEFTTVGPTIGSETTTNALLGVLIASLLIVLYIAWSFRQVPKPASSWRFGVAAIIALLHDALVLLGIFSLLGHFFGVEVDSLFVTAILTVIGFSVHDTIVVFDRIRENLRKMGATHFSHVVNVSIEQTLVRSLSTSLTVILVLLALLLFGGETIRWFIAALFIGIISGTYSSIFNAAPLLVFWQEMVEKRRK